MTTQIPPRSGLDRWGAFLFIFGAWFAAFIAVLVAWLMASGTAVGNPCQGAGFGCFPTERAGIEFFGFLLGIPATIGWFVLGLIVTLLLGLAKSLSWWVRGLLSLGICLAIFGSAAAILIQFS